MKKNYFITGTDTDCGKTLITEALLFKAKQKGLRTIGLKPLAAGGILIDGKWRNPDAIRLLEMATEKLPYEQINPIFFKEAVAPHIAAAMSGKRVSISALTGFVRGAMLHAADLRLIEGAGGWLVPVNEQEPLSNLPKALDLDVILVIGLKLGCINHALLTARAIRQDGLNLAGWVVTQTDPDMQCIEENITTLRNMLGSTFLGFVPYEKSITPLAVSLYLNFPE